MCDEPVYFIKIKEGYDREWAKRSIKPNSIEVRALLQKQIFIVQDNTSTSTCSLHEIHKVFVEIDRNLSLDTTNIYGVSLVFGKWKIYLAVNQKQFEQFACCTMFHKQTFSFTLFLSEIFC